MKPAIVVTLCAAVMGSQPAAAHDAQATSSFAPA